MTTERFTLATESDRAYAWLMSAVAQSIMVCAGRVTIVRRSNA